MSERNTFVAAFGVLFPVSDTMVQRCWRAAETIPQPARDAFAVALLEAARATDQARASARNAVTAAIGREER